MTAIEFRYQLINLQDSLMKFAYSLTTDSYDAKDLVQETLLKALKHSDKYVVESNFKAWTFTIMKNTFINDYRRAARQSVNREPLKESSLINQRESTGSDDPASTYSALVVNLSRGKTCSFLLCPLLTG